MKSVLGIIEDTISSKDYDPDAKDFHKLPFLTRKIVTENYEASPTTKKTIERIGEQYTIRHRNKDQTIILLPSKKEIEAIHRNDYFKTKFSYNINQVEALIKDERILPGLRKGIGIIHAGINWKDTNLILDLFENKQLKLVVTTNVIESGIDIKCDAMFVAENDRIQWDNGQWINFIGRVGRMDGKGTFHAYLHRTKVKDGIGIRTMVQKQFELKSTLNPEDIVPYALLFPEIHKQTIWYLEHGKDILRTENKTILRIARACLMYLLPFSATVKKLGRLSSFLDNPNIDTLNDALKLLLEIDRIKRWTELSPGMKRQVCYYLQFIHDVFHDWEDITPILDLYLGQYHLQLNKKSFKKFQGLEERYVYFTLAREKLL